jgi:hypothetical protein
MTGIVSCEIHTYTYMCLFIEKCEIFILVDLIKYNDTKYDD